MMLAEGNILAEGLTPGMIFGIAVFILWVFGAIVSKKKPDELRKPSPQAQELAEVRRRIREQQAAQKPALTPRIQQKRAKKQQQKQLQPPPPLPTPMLIRSPVAAVARSVSTTPARIQGTPPRASTREIGADPVARGEKSEMAKNIRLMLQRNGIKEAFVLGEVLGNPVAMRDG